MTGYYLCDGLTSLLRSSAKLASKRNLRRKNVWCLTQVETEFRVFKQQAGAMHM